MKAARGHNTEIVTDMKVRVDRIGDDGVDLDEPVTIAWLDGVLGKGSPFRAAAEGRLTAHLAKVEEVVHVRGRASLKLGADCSRCLSKVELVFDAPLEIVMFPRGAEPEASPEGEVEDDDMGIASYDGEEIDLADIVRDEIFLELPMNPLCAETCAGLCANCGANLNETTCPCVPAIDPRWQALGRIKVN